MVWRQISVISAEQNSELVGDLFVSCGALSVTFRDASDQPLYEPALNTHPLWQQTEITALFDEAGDLQEVRQNISGLLDGIELRGWQTTTVEDRAWERAWLDYFQPMQFAEDFWVCPLDQEPPDPAAVNLVMDPGLAFGTGTHETTALCLQWLAARRLNGLRVVDYGCGSGILSVAAILLGAEHCIAVDIDPQALAATRENACRNDVEARIDCVIAPARFDGEADLVIANILADPLIQLRDTLAGCVRTGGTLVLSGILADQVEAVLQSYQPDFEFSTAEIRGDWARLNGIKKAS